MGKIAPVFGFGESPGQGPCILQFPIYLVGEQRRAPPVLACFFVQFPTLALAVEIVSFSPFFEFLQIPDFDFSTEFRALDIGPEIRAKTGEIKGFI